MTAKYCIIHPIKWLAILALPILFGACAGSFQHGDSAPNGHVNIDSIHDPIPRHEPRSKYGNPATYTVLGKTYKTLNSSKGFVQRGVASWYGTKFHGRRTSSGEGYDMYTMTAAHKTLPLPTYVEVTNLDNGRHIIVKVNDRGPFHEGRIIDLSYAAAIKLGINTTGTGPVEIRAIDPDKPHAHRTIPTTPAAIPTVNTQTVAIVPEVKQINYLQAGAFSSRQNAENLRTRLRQLSSHPVHILPSDNIYRVRIGPLNDEEAQALATQLQQQGIGDVKLVID